MNVWDGLASKYDTLWVQKYSLAPTRRKILALLGNTGGAGEDFSLLDVGCGTGQLLVEIKESYPRARLMGIDQSKPMIDAATQKDPAIDFASSAIEEFATGQTFDFITCCHSFPYYPEKPMILRKLSTLLKEDGKAIFIQASINSIYDRLVMGVVEKTAERADYLARADFRLLAAEDFAIEEEFTIKEKWCMPSICGFILRQKP